MAWLRPDHTGRVGPQSIRAALTAAGGFELCVAAVREGLLGTPCHATTTLRERLALAAGRRPAPARGVPQVLDGLVHGKARGVSEALDDGVSLLLARRIGAASTSLARRARLPGAVAELLQDAAATAGEGALRVSAHGSVVYAPDLFPWPQDPRADAPHRVDFTGQTTRLPILMYRGVAPPLGSSTDRHRVSTTAFEAQLRYLRDSGFRSVTLDDWRHARESWQPLPGRAVVITFDGAYRDFAAHAWPLLKRYGFAATVFVVTDHVGGESAPAGSPRPLLDWDDLCRLKDEGVSFGSLTATHSDLTAVPPEAAVRELARSRATLLRRLGGPITALAYPYGAEDEATRHLVGACGFFYGLSARPGPAPLTDPLLALSRIKVHGALTLPQFGRALGDS
jgi:peptidoglycan/xylan/chitin deacetylase (PgdA/CDA1 family)